MHLVKHVVYVRIMRVLHEHLHKRLHISAASFWIAKRRETWHKLYTTMTERRAIEAGLY